LPAAVPIAMVGAAAHDGDSGRAGGRL